MITEVLGEKVKVKKSKKSLGDLQNEHYAIEPSDKPASKLDCSQWPLLLKVLEYFPLTL